MNLSLHIEHLVLDGLPVSAAQGPAVQAALETELTRLLEEGGLADVSGGAFPHLAVPAIQFSPGGTPVHWGRQIARSLFDGLALAAAVPRLAGGSRAPTAPPALISPQIPVNPRNQT